VTVPAAVEGVAGAAGAHPAAGGAEGQRAGQARTVPVLVNRPLLPTFTVVLPAPALLVKVPALLKLMPKPPRTASVRTSNVPPAWLMKGLPDAMVRLPVPVQVTVPPLVSGADALVLFVAPTDVQRAARQYIDSAIPRPTRPVEVAAGEFENIIRGIHAVDHGCPVRNVTVIVPGWLMTNIIAVCGPTPLLQLEPTSQKPLAGVIQVTVAGRTRSSSRLEVWRSAAVGCACMALAGCLGLQVAEASGTRKWGTSRHSVKGRERAASRKKPIRHRRANRARVSGREGL